MTNSFRYAEVLPGAAAVILCSAAVLGSCKKAEPPPAPAPTVIVAPAAEQDVVEWDEYPGRLSSPEIANLAARVSGIIQQAPFEEGALVKEGDLLFVIDDRPFQADYASKQADVGRAEALLGQAEAHFKRYDKLQGTRAISAEDYDEAVAALRQAKANIAVAKAAENISKLNLDWTRVTAPISGRIGRKEITVGNLVNGGAGSATRLTTITSIDPIYSYVNVPERTLVKYRSLINLDPAHAPLPCSIQLESETSFDHDCTVDFIDNQVDVSTGTVAMRGSISNPDGHLTSGLFARMRILASRPYKALLVPDTAIGTDQNRKIVYVVGQNNIVESRPVEPGPLFGKQRAILNGLKRGERVIVGGIQLAHNGAPVTPQESPAPDAPAVAAALPTGQQPPAAQPKVPAPQGEKQPSGAKR